MGKIKVFLQALLKVLLFLVGLSSYGQQVMVSGKVTDSLQNPLAHANVLAMPEADHESVRFAITENNGSYKLGLSKNQTYTLTVSFLGYTTYETRIETTDKNIIKNFVLQESLEQLGTVVLDYKPPVEVKKDTITYRVDAFATGDERKLRELLKKLPGMEVDRLGNVTSQGRKVTKVLVENKTFFTGDSKLAVNNIPADAVEEVEVIDDYNEVAMLKGLNDSEELAMNIKLKEDKKKFVFGDVQAGAGIKNRYLIHPTLFYYSPETNVNFIGDFNNQGTSSFSFRDYIEFEGGFGKLMSGSNSGVSPFRSNIRQFINNQNFKSNIHQFGALNIRQSISNATDISGYVISSNAKSEAETHTENEYLLEDTSYFESRNNTQDLTNFFTIGKLTLEYKPDFEEDFAYNSFIKLADNDGKGLINTMHPSQSNTIATLTDMKNINLKQNIAYSRKLSKNHTGSFEATYSFQKDKPFTEWMTDRQILQGLIPLEEDEMYTILQTKRNSTHNANAVAKHYWVLNNFNHIYTSIGVNATFSEFYSQDEQHLSDGSVNDFNVAGFGNDFGYDFINTFLGLEYKLQVGIATFKPMVYAHFYNWKTKQLEEKNTNTKALILPQFTAKIELNRSEKINFKYKLNARFPDIEQLANNFVLNSFNSVYKGNTSLENQLYHTLNLSYYKFSLIRNLNVNFHTFFNKKVDQIKSITQLQGIDQYSTPMMFDLPEHSWRMMGNVSKTLRKLRYKLNTNFNFSDFHQILNDDTHRNISKSISSTASVETLFREYPNIEVGYTKDFNNYRSFNQVNNFENDRFFVHLRYRFLKNFVFKADYTFDQYQNKSSHAKNAFDTADASLFYQVEDSPWGFEINVTNLFDTAFKQQNSFNSFLIAETKRYILPRIIMFKIAYKL